MVGRGRESQRFGECNILYQLLLLYNPKISEVQIFKNYVKIQGNGTEFQHFNIDPLTL